MQRWGTFKEVHVVGVGVHKSAHSEGVLTFLLLSIVVNYPPRGHQSFVS